MPEPKSIRTAGERNRRLIAGAVVVVVAVFSAIAIWRVFLPPSPQSLADAVDRLIADRHLPAGVRPLIPPQGGTVLGRVDPGGNRRLGHKCFLPIGMQTKNTSLLDQKIEYRSADRIKAELKIERAGADASATGGSRATLKLANTFIRHSMAAYDPQSSCDGQDLEVVDWEWGAAAAELTFGSTAEGGGSWKLADDGGASGGQSVWSKGSKSGTLKAENIILAYGTIKMRTDSSENVETEFAGEINHGDPIALPETMASLLSVSVEKYDRAMVLPMHVRVSGRQDLTTPCESKRTSGDLIVKMNDQQHCIVAVGSASQLVLRWAGSTMKTRVVRTKQISQPKPTVRGGG